MAAGNASTLRAEARYLHAFRQRGEGLVSERKGLRKIGTKVQSALADFRSLGKTITGMVD